jgi:ubiquitin C-terminal hydrolase
MQVNAKEIRMVGGIIKYVIHKSCFVHSCLENESIVSCEREKCVRIRVKQRHEIASELISNPIYKKRKINGSAFAQSSCVSNSIQANSNPNLSFLDIGGVDRNQTCDFRKFTDLLTNRITTISNPYPGIDPPFVPPNGPYERDRLVAALPNSINGESNVSCRSPKTFNYNDCFGNFLCDKNGSTATTAATSSNFPATFTNSSICYSSSGEISGESIRTSSSISTITNNVPFLELQAIVISELAALVALDCTCVTSSISASDICMPEFPKIALLPGLEEDSTQTCTSAALPEVEVYSTTCTSALPEVGEDSTQTCTSAALPEVEVSSTHTYINIGINLTSSGSCNKLVPASTTRFDNSIDIVEVPPGSINQSANTSNVQVQPYARCLAKNMTEQWLHEDTCTRAGLYNIGNYTCYQNSVLQSLCHIDPLRKYVLSDCFLDFVNKSGGECDAICKIGNSLRDVFQNLYTSTGYYTPASFVTNTKHLFDEPRQQDAHEFLVYLYNVIDEITSRDAFTKSHCFDTSEEFIYTNGAIKKNENCGILTDLFGCVLCRETICGACLETKKTFQLVTDLSTPIKINKISKLNQCLNRMNEREILDKIICDSCSQLSTETKSIQYISYYPPYLIIQLNRFDSVNGYKTKCHKNIKIPINELCFYDGTNRIVYELNSCVSHAGTSEKGHFVSYCFDANNKKWYVISININFIDTCLLFAKYNIYNISIFKSKT